MAKQLKDFAKEIQDCLQCGFCLAKCPIYRELRMDPMVARGEINLAKALLEGDIEATKKMDEMLMMCQLCGQCTEACPAGVKTADIVTAARLEVAKRRGLPWIKKAIFSFLKNPSLTPLAMKMGALGQNIAFKKDGDMASERVPIIFGADRFLPKISGSSIMDKYPEVIKVDNPKKRVAYFIGCYSNYVDTELGDAVIGVMKHNGYEVVLPKDQVCCGLPLLAHGDEEGFELLRKNIRIFAKLADEVDAIIVDCATCGATLKETPESFLSDEPEIFELYEKIKDKIVSVEEFLVENGYKEDFGEVDFTVTYHLPCHRSWSDLRGAPRKIIESIPGAKLVEMAEPERCCGNAGSHMLTHYDLASQVRARKLEDIKQTEADYCMTPCPGCRMFLGEGVRQQKLDTKIVHPIKLMAQAYQAGGQKALPKAN